MAPNETSPLLPSRTLPPLRNGARRHRILSIGIPLFVALVVGIAFYYLHHCASNESVPFNQGTPSTGNGNSTNPSKFSPVETREKEVSNRTNDELLAFVPPFESTNHVIPPKLINQDLLPGAVPTNAFWTNFLVGDDHGLNQGAGQVTLSPYTVRNLPQRLEVSYGNDRRVVSNESIVEYFNADIAFSGFSNDQTKRATSREVVAFDPFSVTLQYYFQNETNDNANHFFKPFLVRGSPYMTVEYQNISPLLEFNSTIKKINQKPILNSNTFTDSRFEIEMEVYSTKNTSKLQKWIIYFEEERTLKVKFVNEIHQAPYSVTGWINAFTLYRLIDQRPYTGVIRAAIVPEDPQDDTIKLLDQHVALYPIRTSIQHEVNGLTGKIHFCWETKQFRSIKHVPSLLVLADPHHMDSFSPIQSPGFEIQKQMGHRTLKSYMTPILLGQNHCWILEEKLSKIMWNAPQNVPDQYVAPIKEALLKDANFTPQALDPYFFGKEISRQARLVLIADRLKLEETRDHLLNHMEKWIEPWMIGQNMDPFVYDKKWGGICSKNGLAGVFWMTDFGNGWYNDHHFHYGYFIYSLAVVAKYRPSFVQLHKSAILSIVRDIANPNEEDMYFPLTRHFSWYDGHSFASGVYTLDGGKSQESISEAINAYYGVYLLGKALGVAPIEKIGHLLMTLEMRAAKTYWQMPKKNSIYEELYSQNKMTGQVASTKVSYTTWFGPQVEHMHLINMIPFTPIAEDFLLPEYIQEEYPVLLDKAFGRKQDPMDKRWKGYAYLALAIIHPEEAWKKVTALDFFDDGSSLTSSLYWIATRPNTTAPPNL